MTRMYKPMDAAEQTAFARTHCRLCPRQIGCTILADAKPLDTTDPDYPDELVFDDVGEPSCTAFAAAVDPTADEAFPPATARPAAATAARAAAKAASAAKRPKPVTIRADRPVQSVIITTRTGRDGVNLSSTIRLQIAGGAR